MGIAERKQLEKHARRQLILDSAADIFHEKGFAGATMEDIAARAQIAVGTIYLYYKSKADIYFSLTKSALADLSNRLKRIAGNKQNDPDVKIRKLMSAVEAFYVQDRDAYELISHKTASDLIQLFPEDNLETIRQIMRSNLKQMEIVIEEGIQKGIYKKINPYAGAVVFWSSFMGTIDFQENRMVQGKKDYRKATLELFTELMLAGLKK